MSIYSSGKGQIRTARRGGELNEYTFLLSARIKVLESKDENSDEWNLAQYIRRNRGHLIGP